MATDRDTTEEGHFTTAESAVRRGRDDRRGEVKPASNPAPSSPAADERIVREGEETLERVKPY
ncbi:MAG TPA: hypothetical protein VGI87_16400 [Solirubrobacteraceae bacterium]|jgi:hypothetical protein